MVKSEVMLRRMALAKLSIFVLTTVLLKVVFVALTPAAKGLHGAGLAVQGSPGAQRRVLGSAIPRHALAHLGRANQFL